MQTGALIVAAGKSSRMGDFKPMLQLGSISIAQRVINNFRQAGISKIVVVTGYRADVLERHLASNNVIFLRNEDYASTHMFDSVRIGLELSLIHIYAQTTSASSIFSLINGRFRLHPNSKERSIDFRRFASLLRSDSKRCPAAAAI